MSEASLPNNPLQGRRLSAAELELLRTMLAGVRGKPQIKTDLTSVLVEDMQDGGMGSVRFLAPGAAKRHLGGAVAQAEYVDDDGVPVYITINVDREDHLYEIEFWKVDFSPLKRYPGATG
jgi:hypothetical protein